MAFIYKIVNDVNDKIYIGKTDFSVEKRFKEHCNDKEKEYRKDRPLYQAMNKYGIEHFHISQIEEVPSEKAAEREQYWINFYNSYHYGYNATLGGDGSYRANRNLVLSLYNKGLGLKEIKERTSYDPKTIKNILKEKYSSEEIHKTFLLRAQSNKFIKVAQIDPKTNEIIKVFNSISEAEKEVSTGRHMPAVCKGKRKTAGGFIWKYVN